MRRDDVVRILQDHLSELRVLGVQSIALFGSCARDEARPDSDVDLLVELNQRMGFFGFGKLQRHLEALLHRHVDLVTPDALRPTMRDDILREAVYV